MQDFLLLQMICKGKREKKKRKKYVATRKERKLLHRTDEVVVHTQSSLSQATVGELSPLIYPFSPVVNPLQAFLPGNATLAILAQKKQQLHA